MAAAIKSDELQNKATEMMKKVLTVGVGAFFLTEEALRGLVSDFKLPKELLSAVLDSAGKSRSEFLRSLSREVMTQVMDRVDLKALLEELITKNELELEVKINLKPKKRPHSTGV
ncbi:hypothetical protein EBS43_01435 [bacterium]|jgi:hypothetical protein|nr:hypothetical protein [bacterium]